MSDTPTYLVTARAASPLARCVDDVEPRAHRRNEPPFAEANPKQRTPASFRREWFAYVRESGNDLA